MINQTKFVIVWEGNLKLRGDIPPPPKVTEDECNCEICSFHCSGWTKVGYAIEEACEIISVQ